MKVPIEQHYHVVDGKLELVSTTSIEVDKDEFARKMAALIRGAFPAAETA